MPTLYELAAVLRSKNAGPFEITIDVMFDDDAAYRRVRDCGALDAKGIALLYGVAPESVRVIPFDRVRAIKVTLPRTSGARGSGSAGDRDVYGAQQHAPLAQIAIP